MDSVISGTLEMSRRYMGNTSIYVDLQMGNSMQQQMQFQLQQQQLFNQQQQQHLEQQLLAQQGTVGGVGQQIVDSGTDDKGPSEKEVK